MAKHECLDLDSTELVFHKLNNLELKKKYLLFWFMAKPSLVGVGKFFIRHALKSHLPVDPLLEATIFRQFCGGTTLEKTRAAVDALWASGIGSILDLSIEEASTEETRDRVAEQIVKGIEFAASIRPKVPMYAVKLTGLFDFKLLERMHAKQLLSHNEDLQYANGLKRIEAIALAAQKCDVPISIDAEQSWIQDPIDQICLSLMRRYNKTKPIIGTTFQFYRNDRLALFESFIQTAKTDGFTLSFKAVRGAYMESERERARLYSYSSPIYHDKQGSDAAFDRSLELAIENINCLSFWVATHNQQSCETAIQLMRKRGLPADDARVGFAQLKGMSDNISFNLAHAGYRVAKYVPYGSVRHVLPYLFRRADENTAVSKEQPARELEFIRRELQRRRH